ncbi:hypothetical protein Ctob_001024 [Chrysochromulina tobinii]|uniref:Uncharacterized protein n=1 Tax=Chrysochromulina tobinii TaxID=1460289 RepID=A0A0M0JA42_9EUKA|nr:hypothetical protein Ctob_001024 [Chrysochromulina tobinii]|eukprot:KOO23365.1 hypothetical protein Ctob_001024 [Chrysochromulina sp. CCMP291]
MSALSSTILQQARTGLTSALREVRSCRAARQQCNNELEVCRAGTLAEDKRHLSDDQHLQTEAQHCLVQLQHTREQLQARTQELADEKGRAETITNAAQKQLATARSRLQQATSAEAACKTQLEQTASAEAQQQQVQAQLGVLRRKLEQKEQLEDAIEGKHSKLTEVQPCVPDSH